MATTHKGYTLTLSEQEAQILVNLLGTIGGTPDAKHRTVTNSIWTSLHNAGVVPELSQDFYWKIYGRSCDHVYLEAR